MDRNNTIDIRGVCQKLANFREVGGWSLDQVTWYLYIP